MPDPQAPSRLIRNSRREAVLVLLVWAGALIWTVGVSYLLGFQHGPDSLVVRAGLASDRTPDNFHQIFGFPDWIFAGVVLPWAVCSFATLVFCLRGIQDDNLGAEATEPSGSAESGEEAKHGH